MGHPGVHMCVVAACFGFPWPKQSQGWGNLICASFFALLIWAGLPSVNLVFSIPLVICYPNDVWMGLLYVLTVVPYESCTFSRPERLVYSHCRALLVLHFLCIVQPYVCTQYPASFTLSLDGAALCK